MRKRKHTLPESADVNVIPFIDMLSVLIIFLIMVASFLNMGVVETTLPAAGVATATEQKQEKQDKPRLDLTIAITDKGFFVGGAGAILTRRGEPTIPKKEDGSYDFEALSRKLLEVKQKFPDEWDVIILPEDQIEYEIIIKTMDAAREIWVEPEKCPSVEVKRKNEQKGEEAHSTFEGKKIRCILFPNVAIAAGII